MARYLGIEVTDGQVKGVVLRTAYRKLMIEAVSRVARTAAGPEGLSAALSQLLTDVGGAFDGAYAALPGTDVSLRILELPRAVLRRGGRVIATELEGSLPFEIDAAMVDAQTIRQDGANVQMLAAAARTERVRTLIDALKAGGIDPREVGAGAVALGGLAREIPELSVPGPILLMNAYETNADFVVLVNGIAQMARTLSGQTTPSARDRGVRQTLSAYLAAGGEPPVAAYLCGESAYHNMDVVADAAGLSAEAVHMGIPLGPIELAPSVEPTHVQLAPLALALAFRGLGRGDRIDLRKGELAVSGGSQFLRERGWLLAGCVLAILMSFGFTTYMRYVSLAQERDRLKQALARVTVDVFGERVTDPQRARALALGTSGDGDQDPLPLADAYDVIGAISTRIPDTIHHDITSLDIQDEHVQLQGLVDTLADRDRIVESLSHYECFQNVQPGRAQRNPGDNRQQYTLDIELRCPERQNAGRRGGPGAPATGGSTTRTTGGTSGSGN